jgi:DNA polymerase
MPDKLYQECRTLISGCRAIFEDLLETGVDTLPLTPHKAPAASSQPDDSPDDQPNRQRTAQEAAGNSGGAETLADIRRELSDCRGCTLHDQSAPAVLGSGNPNARLVLVGGGPGPDEESGGEPFGGEPGQLLERILLAMKLTPEDVYICNLVKCQPPNNREPEQAEISACEAILKRQLAAIAPEMILSLGRLATQALLQTDEPLDKLCGRWRTYAGIPLMPTFHPAYLLQNPAGKHQVWQDVKQVMHRLQDSEG